MFFQPLNQYKHGQRLSIMHLRHGNFLIMLQCPAYICSIRKYAIYVLQGQVRALEQYQASSGMWHTLIDDDTSYLESSCTAGFCYGILKGIRKGYIDREYEECGRKALEAVLEK